MKKKLIFVNDVPNQFIEHQEYIKEAIDDYFNAFDLDCELKIRFIDFANENEYECTDCMVKNISVKKYELLITNDLLNSINFDGGECFCLSIYHELEHIRDFIHMMQTKLFKFNLCLAHHKNFERQYISTGVLFWTEVYAYYKTLIYAKENNLNFEKITFCNLVKNYLKTIAHNKSLYYRKDLSYDEAEKYTKTVDSFIYLCAKYMASAYAYHSRVPYKRIEKNKYYKKVYSILCKLEPKVKSLMNNKYSPKSYDNLFRLGKYICENLRWKKFKVGLIKEGIKIFSFY